MHLSLSPDTLTLIAARTATLLCGWLNVNPLRKNDNGDREGGTSGLAMLLGAFAQRNEPRPPDDVHERITKYLVELFFKQLAEDRSSIYETFGVDYDPDRELKELSQACGITTSWPIKSCMWVRVYSDRIEITDRQGYRAPEIHHNYVKDRGWVVSACAIDPKLMPTILAAIDAGTISQEIAWLDPSVPLTTSSEQQATG